MWDFHSKDQVPCELQNHRMEEEAEQFLSCQLIDGNFFSTVWTCIDVVHTSFMTSHYVFIYIRVYLFQPTTFYMWLIVYFFFCIRYLITYLKSILSSLLSSYHQRALRLKLVRTWHHILGSYVIRAVSSNYESCTRLQCYAFNWLLLNMSRYVYLTETVKKKWFLLMVQYKKIFLATCKGSCNHNKRTKYVVNKYAAVDVTILKEVSLFGLCSLLWVLVPLGQNIWLPEPWMLFLLSLHLYVRSDIWNVNLLPMCSGLQFCMYIFYFGWRGTHRCYKI